MAKTYTVLLKSTLASYARSPYVMASQVRQVFYVDDPVEQNVNYVIKKLPRDWCDGDNQNAVEEDIKNPNLDDIDCNFRVQTDVADESYFRDDIPKTQIPPQS